MYYPVKNGLQILMATRGRHTNLITAVVKIMTI